MTLGVTGGLDDGTPARQTDSPQEPAINRAFRHGALMYASEVPGVSPIEQYLVKGICRMVRCSSGSAGSFKHALGGFGDLSNEHFI